MCDGLNADLNLAHPESLDVGGGQIPSVDGLQELGLDSPLVEEMLEASTTISTLPQVDHEDAIEQPVHFGFGRMREELWREIGGDG